MKLSTWANPAAKLVKAGSTGLVICAMIWALIRLAQRLTHQHMVQTSLIVLLSSVMFVLLLLVVCGFCILGANAVLSTRHALWVCLSWALFVLSIPISFLILFNGFRIAVIGLDGLLAGSTASTQQSFYSLVKFYPFHPLIPLEMGTLATLGLIDLSRYQQVMWDGSALFWIFSACTVVAAVPLFLDTVSEKIWWVSCLTISAGVALMVKGSHLNNTQLAFFHGLAICMLTGLVVGVYQEIRCQALWDLYLLNYPLEYEDHLLPPHSHVLLLFLFLIFPLIADLQNSVTVRSQQGLTRTSALEAAFVPASQDHEKNVSSPFAGADAGNSARLRLSSVNLGEVLCRGVGHSFDNEFYSCGRACCRTN